MAIQYRTTGILVNVGGKEVYARVQVVMDYSERDPFEVSLTFLNGTDDPPVWIMARDLFFEAFEEGCSGGGDVILIDNDDVLTLVLESPEGAAAIELDSEVVNYFLDDTLLRVPAGRESMDDEIEKFLASL